MISKRFLKAQAKMQLAIDRRPASRRASLFAYDSALARRLASPQPYLPSYREEPRGHLWIHWFYQKRDIDALSRCEQFHINMLQHFDFLGRVKHIHVRCTAPCMTSAVQQAIESLAAGRAELDFQLVEPKASWEHDTFKEAVEFAVASGENVAYVHFKGVTRVADPRLGILPRGKLFGELDIFYWDYLMYLALATAPGHARAVGPLIHLGLNKSYRNRDLSWSQLCKGDQVFHYCGSFQAFDGKYIGQCLEACGLGSRREREQRLWIGDPYAVEMFLSSVALREDVYSLDIPYTATSDIYRIYSRHRAPQYEEGFRSLFAQA